MLKQMYRRTNPNIIIGSRFRAYHRPRIEGPGKVVIGDKVNIRMSFLRRPAIVTHTGESIVTIGNDCTLAGTRISCVGSVSIGENGLVGITTIMDTDVIPDESMVIDEEWKKQHTCPVTIGAEFWGGTNSYILRGSKIHDECVLGAGSVTREKAFPDKSLIVGNPARKIGVTRS